MIDAVICFAVLLATFEFVLLSMVPPRYRLRLLGNQAACNAVHVFMLAINLAIHWGTVTGTMAATGSFVVSIVTVAVAKVVYGTIANDVRTRRGIIGYKNAELMM